MPSPRRVKAFASAALIMVVIMLWYSSSARQTSNQEFYIKTVSAMTHKDDLAREKVEDNTVQQRLQEAEAAAKKAADAKGPKKPQFDVTAPLEKGVAGRKKMPVEPPEQKPLTEEEIEEKKVEDEMNGILKKGPIIIFSKSYCPHSARAKSILLDKYSIDPAPYVVELDKHPMGQQLQALLAKNTGRKTVPNVLVSGKSIGGGDETKALDESGELPEKVRRMGGKRIMEVELRKSAEATDRGI